MLRFIQMLQLIIIVTLASLISYDYVFNGIGVFEDKYMIISAIFGLMLEVSLFVIYKLIEDD